MLFFRPKLITVFNFNSLDRWVVNSSNNINCGQRRQIILATIKMQGLLKLFLLACLFTISLAQCSGSFSNATQQVTLNWTVIDSNTVNFVYTAPSTNTQYTALAFSNQPISQASLFVSCKKLKKI